MKSEPIQDDSAGETEVEDNEGPDVTNGHSAKKAVVKVTKLSSDDINGFGKE